MNELLRIERDGAVAIITLDRPEKRNALSIELREVIAARFSELAGDDEVACTVLTGAGSAFSSGMDTTQFGGDRAHKERLVECSLAAFGAVGSFPKPLIAAVNGAAVAGGFALALLCDIRLASESATFGFPELPRGIPPSYAAARAALPAALARELCLTGRLLDAREALALGVVSEVHSGEELVARARELAAGIGAMPRAASASTKQRILLDRERTAGALFAAEEEELRAALLS